MLGWFQYHYMYLQICNQMSVLFCLDVTVGKYVQANFHLNLDNSSFWTVEKNKYLLWLVYNGLLRIYNKIISLNITSSHIKHTNGSWSQNGRTCNPDLVIVWVTTHKIITENIICTKTNMKYSFKQMYTRELFLNIKLKTKQQSEPLH